MVAKGTKCIYDTKYRIYQVLRITGKQERQLTIVINQVYQVYKLYIKFDYNKFTYV